ncbi:palmitoyl-acyl carrier protein thioesterase [Canna indica]|uniref:Palmitoyl-acyl carrier protein thioesterase n=1 Tax=Canna indica TaxID=4628 RepID=A0AAQ3K1X6_9LILI|nr:palmitoyl-acyl carrier protein thioesterase [Canna indica]
MELNMAQVLSEVESAKCECCGLEEECTEEYISRVKADFGEKWLCGLCAEAVRDEAGKGRKKKELVEAVKEHISFCRRLQSNPAIHVVDGMRQMLRRRSVDMPSSSDKRPVKSLSSSQVADDASVSLLR